MAEKITQLGSLMTIINVFVSRSQFRVQLTNAGINVSKLVAKRVGRICFKQREGGRGRESESVRETGKKIELFREENEMGRGRRGWK